MTQLTLLYLYKMLVSWCPWCPWCPGMSINREDQDCIAIQKISQNFLEYKRVPSRYCQEIQQKSKISLRYKRVAQKSSQNQRIYSNTRQLYRNLARKRDAKHGPQGQLSQIRNKYPANITSTSHSQRILMRNPAESQQNSIQSCIYHSKGTIIPFISTVTRVEDEKHPSKISNKATNINSHSYFDEKFSINQALEQQLFNLYHQSHVF